VIRNLVQCGHSEVIKEGGELFDQAQEEQFSAISADLRSSVYKAKLKTCPDDSALNRLIKLAEETDSAEERLRIYASLGAAKG